MASMSGLGHTRTFAEGAVTPGFGGKAGAPAHPWECPEIADTGLNALRAGCNDSSSGRLQGFVYGPHGGCQAAASGIRL
jgi:hypothetical protein